jgi:hypothetical protein
MDRRPLAGWACACSLSAGRQQLKQFRRRSSGCVVLVRLVVAAGSGAPIPACGAPVSLAIALNGFVSGCDSATDRLGGTADEEEFGPGSACREFHATSRHCQER